ncbi:MAG: hypothetical protein ACLQM8_19560, partial [Limisphaerales bacterium]
EMETAEYAEKGPRRPGFPRIPRCNSRDCPQTAKIFQPRISRMARIEEIRVDPWHPWFIFFLGCGFAALKPAGAHGVTRPTRLRRGIIHGDISDAA